jgi:acetone carboxylase, alpha subunit
MYVENGEQLSLKELVERRDRVWEKTGHYWGIEEFDLKASDPGRFARLSARIINACVSSRDRARYVAASPAAREMGELCFTFLTADGDPVGISQGLIAHVAQFGHIVRWMIDQDYELNPGIRDGDIFEANDPKVGVCHTPDQYLFVPIVINDEVIGWTAAINHVLDIGAAQPGSMSTAAPNMFADGFHYPPLRTGENHEHYSWWYRVWERNTRLGTMNILDAKMRLAGAVFLRNYVLDIVEEFGLNYFKQALREIVEEGRRLVLARIRDLLVPGVCENNAAYLIEGKGWTPAIRPEGDKDSINSIFTTVSVDKDATLIIDSHRTSREQPNAHNLYPGAVRLSYFPFVLSQFAPFGLANAGAAFAVDIRTELGTCLNPIDPFAASSAATPAGKIIPHPVHSWFRMMLAKGYLEECVIIDNQWGADEGGGTLRGGVPWAFTNFEWTACYSQGAWAFKDGESTVWCPWSPETDCGTAEDWEYFMPPLFYMGRKLQVNSCGHGKYRGGLAAVSCFVCLDPGPNMGVHATGAGMSGTTHLAYGEGGGYPISGIFLMRLGDTNIRELIAQGEPYPSDAVECFKFIKSGKLKVGEVNVFKAAPPTVTLKDGDIWIKVMGAAGGFGDPLERDPVLVEEDVKRGWITADVALSVYGVVVEGPEAGAAKLNQGATTAARKAAMERRKREAVPAQEHWKRARERFAKRDYSPLVSAFYPEHMTDSRRQWLADFWRVDPEEAWRDHV